MYQNETTKRKFVFLSIILELKSVDGIPPHRRNPTPPPPTKNIKRFGETMGLLPALGIVQLEFQGVAMGSVYYPLDIFY